MRESTFFQQNEKKWKGYEEILRGDRRAVSPDVLADLYTQLTDDLSFARTHFPDSKTTTYLNQLAGQVHVRLFRAEKVSRNRFLRFWEKDLPEAMARNLNKMLVSFLIFGIAVIIGALATSYDENFLRNILGDGYVDMTLENIRTGKPLSVYDGENEGLMFLQITLNNIRVSFLVFVAGILLSFGTGYLLFSNGIMLGAFHGFLAHHGYLGDSLLVVYIHGTLEISAIILAGGAGFCIGNSILFPGTYSRGHSLLRGAGEGLMIVLGLVPIFIMAGFLESFVTRQTQVPGFLNWAIILSTGSLILWYFVMLPLRIRMQMREQEAAYAV